MLKELSKNSLQSTSIRINHLNDLPQQLRQAQLPQIIPRLCSWKHHKIRSNSTLKSIRPPLVKPQRLGRRVSHEQSGHMTCMDFAGVM